MALQKLRGDEFKFEPNLGPRIEMKSISLSTIFSHYTAAAGVPLQIQLNNPRGTAAAVVVRGKPQFSSLSFIRSDRCSNFYPMIFDLYLCFDSSSLSDFISENVLLYNFQKQLEREFDRPRSLICSFIRVELEFLPRVEFQLEFDMHSIQFEELYIYS